MNDWVALIGFDPFDPFAQYLRISPAYAAESLVTTAATDRPGFPFRRERGDANLKPSARTSPVNNGKRADEGGL